MFLLELKKLLKIRGIGISITLLFLCMILNAVNNSGMLNRFKTDILTDEAENTAGYQEKLFKKFYGTEYSETTYQQMLAEYNGLYDGSDENTGEEKGKYGPQKKYDRYVFSSLLASMEYLQTFEQDLEDIIIHTEQIRQNNQNLGKYRDAYKERETTAVIEAYSDIRAHIAIRLCYTTSAFWYCFSTSEGANGFNHQLLLIFICCVITIYFTSEYEGKMHQMTYTAYNGHLYLFMLKNRIVFLISLLIAVFSCMIDASVISLHLGSLTDALKQPIQLICDNQGNAVAEFCPFEISFGQYMLLACFMKFTALYFAANICILISVWSKRSVPATVISVLLNVGLLQFTIYASQQNLMIYEQKSSVLRKIFIWLKTYSPLSLLWSRDYVTTYDAVRFFGIPVHRLQFALAFSWIIITTVLFINGCLYCKRSNTHETRISKFIKKIRKNGSPA